MPQRGRNYFVGVDLGETMPPFRGFVMAIIGVNDVERLTETEQRLLRRVYDAAERDYNRRGLESPSYYAQIYRQGIGEQPMTAHEIRQRELAQRAPAPPPFRSEYEEYFELRRRASHFDLLRPGMAFYGNDPATDPIANMPDPLYDRYKKRGLKDYAKTAFEKVKDILPKDILAGAVMIPKEDVKKRIDAYLDAA